MSLRKEKNSITKEELRVTIQDLKENPFHKFNIVFAITSFIPFLAFLYLMTSRFGFNIFQGDALPVLFTTIFLCILGFVTGYRLIRNILQRVIDYAARAKHSEQQRASLMAIVSHDFKNPLAIIGSSLDNIYDGLLGQINEGQKRMIDVCRSAIERMTRLITDLLDTYQIETGRFEIKPALHDLADMLLRQVKEHLILAADKKIEIFTEVPQGDATGWFDENRMLQVVNNLLSNAVKYSVRGTEVRVRLFCDSSSFRMEFLDSAEPIPSDKLSRVFDKFERLDKIKEGTGLGLSIVREIVTLHDGKVWAEHRSDKKGNKFMVVISRNPKPQK